MIKRKDRYAVQPITPGGAPNALHDALDAVFIRVEREQRSMLARLTRLAALGLALILIVVTAGVALGAWVAS